MIPRKLGPGITRRNRPNSSSMASMPSGRAGADRFGLRYPGLAKNKTPLFMLFGLANVPIATRRLFELQARGAS